MIIGTILTGIGIGLTAYNTFYYLKHNKTEYQSIIIGKDNKVIQVKKVLDEQTIDYNKKSYVLDKDLFIKLGTKFYQFHYVDNINPLDLREIDRSTISPDTLNSILYNDFAKKLNESTRKSPDIKSVVKDNIILIGIAILIGIFMFFT